MLHITKDDKGIYHSYYAWRAMCIRAAGANRINIHWDGDKDTCECLVINKDGKCFYWVKGLQHDTKVMCDSIGAWDGEQGYVKQL